MTDHVATDEEIRVLDWQAHNYEESLRVLRYHHAVNNPANNGERIAAMVNSKSKSELAKIVGQLAEETEDTVVDALELAEDSLRERLSLVSCALGRLIVADVASNRSA